MKAVPRIHIISIIITVLTSNLFGQLSIKHINTDYQYVTVEIKQPLQAIQTNLNKQMIFNIASVGPIDPNGLRVRLTQIWSTINLRWENLRKIENEYPDGKFSTNAASEIRRRYTYYWQNDNWASYGWWGDETDENGNYNKTVSYATGGEAMQEIYYNGPYANGQPASWLSLLKDGTEWINHQRGNYTYNSDGDLTVHIYENWENDSWVIQGRGVFTYTQPGCLDQMIWYNDDNGTWNANWRSTYVYDRTDCMTEMVPYQQWPLLDCNPTQIIEETSSDNGVTWISSATNTYSDFGTDCLPRTYNYANGVQNKSYFEFATVPGGKVSSTSDNSNLRCTKITTQNFTDGAWVNIEKTWYSYKGLLLNTESEVAIPDEFSLAQNYPNPFNPTTTIDFTLANESIIKLAVYDLAGKLVKEIVNTRMNAGNKSLIWDGTDNNGSKVGAGVYLYKLQTDNFTESKKMILLK